LAGFIHNSIVRTCEYLGLKTEIVRSSEIYQNQYLSSSDRVLDICLKENADTYINPIGGIELYEKEFFEKEKINLFFIKTAEVKYSQFHSDEFVPWLSIIDVMMFNSKEEIKIMLEKFKLF
jgi:hypothetical protein